ncbi:pimeloyl-ACP methyl ester carboxylesterase [Leifsonia sp. EB41]|uniref:alpha/beta fold hydrolase n=1 Tax=Leifsonia sp. EB41 TaxID=3156260 RepID=UPI003514756E
MTTKSEYVQLPSLGMIELTVEDLGVGQPFLLLHGGAGPQSVLPFAERFATVKGVRVLVPVHPGFGGTARPDGLRRVDQLAEVYTVLVDSLDLQDVTVIGNSLGGWITAEIALRKDPRISGIVLLDAVGLDVPGHPVADFFGMDMDEVFSRTFHDPARFAFDPASLPPAAQAVAAGNRSALAAYAGDGMTDAALAERLADLELPTLVLWGESDRIADPDYGRAYAAAIPMARFVLLEGTGHAPQQETPERVIDAIWNSGELMRSPAAAPANTTE